MRSMSKKYGLNKLNVCNQNNWCSICAIQLLKLYVPRTPMPIWHTLFWFFFRCIRSYSRVVFSLKILAKIHNINFCKNMYGWLVPNCVHTRYTRSIRFQSSTWDFICFQTLLWATGRQQKFQNFLCFSHHNRWYAAAPNFDCFP